LLTIARDFTTPLTTYTSLFGAASATKTAACFDQADWQGHSRRELLSLYIAEIQLTVRRRTTRRAMQVLLDPGPQPTNLKNGWNA